MGLWSNGYPRTAPARLSTCSAASRERVGRVRLAAVVALLLGAAAPVWSAAPADAPAKHFDLGGDETSTQPSTPSVTEPATESTTLAATQPAPSLFFDSEDGAFDISNFLSTRVGFLPLAMPITEPAVGYGLALGLSFFHDKPQAVTYPSQPPRIIMPSITTVFGASTENGTWATGVAHIGIWDEGKIRYTGAVGYTSLNLDWFGKGDSLGDHSISYTNNLFFLYQKITFKLGDTNFFLGPQYRLLSTDTTFAHDASTAGVPTGQLQSQTAGLGAVLAYDSLDQPFSPTRGVRAEVSYSQQAEAFGGDFDYGRLNAFAITYLPLTDKFVLGLRVDGGLITGGQAPFYDLPGLNTRGIPRGRYVDNAALLTEAELRYDLTDRWSAIGFGSIGRVADTFGELGSADNQIAIGGGFRYLIARQYGLRLGLDLAYSDDGDWAVYVTMGTGWLRP